MQHFSRFRKRISRIAPRAIGIILALAVGGCGGIITSATDDRHAIDVRDTTAQDGFPAKTIECKVVDTCDDLARQLCPQGFDIVRSITQKNDGSFTATIRCKR